MAVAQLRGPFEVAFALGTSNQAWGPFALPLRLDPLGMPGCTLYTSVDQLATGLFHFEIEGQAVIDDRTRP